eukprot:CAMPEP_0174263870 /NCGR_PEP_ID=MMETSP0439-20130205/20439_1 /TAXON_ID=0 /ORGANISM="Stereomyxa ramosa, Strain Chinc5" /LENGTH=506 /DNA_ID=CAMNT_0015349481 /DNA_START=64 /DNA_END=1581 /DNA_ORIENTATION=-
MVDIGRLVTKAWTQTVDAVLNTPEMEIRIREATNSDEWGPSTTQLNEIAQASFSYEHIGVIMNVIWARLNERVDTKQITKTLRVVDYLLRNGSEQAIRVIRYHRNTLAHFTSYSPSLAEQSQLSSQDLARIVRQRAEEIIELLNSDEYLQEARAKAANNRGKYEGYGSDSMRQGIRPSYPSYDSRGYDSEPRFDSRSTYDTPSYGYDSYDSGYNKPLTTRRDKKTPALTDSESDSDYTDESDSDDSDVGTPVPKASARQNNQTLLNFLDEPTASAPAAKFDPFSGQAPAQKNTKASTNNTTFAPFPGPPTRLGGKQQATNNTEEFFNPRGGSSTTQPQQQKSAAPLSSLFDTPNLLSPSSPNKPPPGVQVHSQPISKPPVEEEDFEDFVKFEDLSISKANKNDIWNKHSDLFNLTTLDEKEAKKQQANGNAAKKTPMRAMGTQNKRPPVAKTTMTAPPPQVQPTWGMGPYQPQPQPQFFPQHPTGAPVPGFYNPAYPVPYPVPSPY